MSALQDYLISRYFGKLPQHQFVRGIAQKYDFPNQPFRSFPGLTLHHLFGPGFSNAYQNRIFFSIYPLKRILGNTTLLNKPAMTFPVKLFLNLKSFTTFFSCHDRQRYSQHDSFSPFMNLILTNIFSDRNPIGSSHKVPRNIISYLADWTRTNLNKTGSTLESVSQLISSRKRNEFLKSTSIWNSFFTWRQQQGNTTLKVHGRQPIHLAMSNEVFAKIDPQRMVYADPTSNLSAAKHPQPDEKQINESSLRGKAIQYDQTDARMDMQMLTEKVSQLLERKIRMERQRRGL